MPVVEILAAVAGVVSAVVSVGRVLHDVRNGRKEKRRRRGERKDTRTSFAKSSHCNVKPSRDNEPYYPIFARNEERVEQRNSIDPQRR